VGAVFDRYARRWAMQQKVVLYDEFRTLLTEGVCHWAGVGLASEEAEGRGRELSAMYEESATIGLGQFRGRAARRSCEEWVGGQLSEIRVGRREVCPNSAAYILATGEEADGTLIDLQGATVDLLSVLRPTVAVSLFLTFAAHALYKFPKSRERLVGGDDLALQSFAQEVRRYYPFFPLTAAVVTEPVEYMGYHLPRGRRVVMSLYGTNHDPKIWDQPEEFRPERFDNWKPTPNTLVPQGGGNQETNHRCVGEALTIELLKMVVDRLVNDMDYTVPEQNLEPDMSRAPALIPSGFEITDVRLNSATPPALDDSSSTKAAHS
jgi:fatty-acid peroxygenase